MSTESDTPKDSNDGSDQGEKKNLRLRLGRKAESGDSEETPASEDAAPAEEKEETSTPPLKKISLKRKETPEAEQEREETSPSSDTEDREEVAPDQGSGGDSGGSRPIRMKLNRNAEVEQKDADAGQQQSEASEEKPVEEALFSEDDFGDFDMGETAETSSPSSPAEKKPPFTNKEEKEEEGWSGAPEAQMTPPESTKNEEKEESPEEPEDKTTPPPEQSSLPEKQSPPAQQPGSQSGLKLKTRDPIRSDDQPPEGLSHGTLTPFERDKAVSDSKAGAEEPPPLPPVGKKQRKKKPPAHKKEKGSGKKTAKKESHLIGILLIIFVFILFLGILTAGLAMILGWGPFATAPEETQPQVVESPPPAEEPITPVEDTTQPATPVSPEQALPESPEETGQAAEESPVETSTPSEVPSLETTEDGRPVIRVEDVQEREIAEGDESLAPTQTQPIEEEEPSEPEPDSRIKAWVDNMNISGANASRQIIIYNNTRYEKDQFVDFNLGVRFIGIQGRNLYFQDQRGAVYVREF